MEKFIITQDIIRNARDYLPIDNKELFANLFAEKCVVKANSEKDEVAGKTDLSLPSMFKEDFRAKNILLMSFFISYYLCIPLDEKKPFASTDYDYYAGSHIFNQLEKFKKDEVIKDKVFDILADYRDFKRFVDNAIVQVLSTKNDALSRFSAAIQLTSDPEYIKNAVEEIKKHSDTLAERAKAEGEKE